MTPDGLPTLAPTSSSTGWASATSSWPGPPTTVSDVVLAAERLDNVPPDQRGWEWRYLKRLTRGGLFTLYGHTARCRARRSARTGRASSPAVGPDGEGVGRADGHALARTERPHGSGDERVVQPGRTRIVTAESRRHGEGVGRADGHAPARTEGHTTGSVESVAFSPDGTRDRHRQCDRRRRCGTRGRARPCSNSRATRAR